jgi:hypothetical protein
MEISKIVITDKDIKKIKSVNSDELVVIGYDNSFKSIDPENEFKLVHKLKFSKLVALKENDNRFDVSNNAEYIAILNQETKSVIVTDVEEKQIIFDINWHRGEVESLKFDNQCKYLATGGQDGKVVIWSLDTEDMIYTLKPHKDFVSAVQFSKDGNFFASTSYDRLIHITNLNHIDKSYSMKIAHKTAIQYLYFISQDRLITIDKQGQVGIYDYRKRHFVKFLKSANEPITAVTFLFNYHFMVLADKLGRTHIYDLDKDTKIDTDFLNLDEKIVDMTYLSKDGYLCIATIKRVIFYNINDDEHKLKSLITLQRFTQAYTLVNHNPFLIYSTFYTELENIWEDSDKQAIEYLSNLNVDAAKNILLNFVNVPQKREYITKLLNDFSDIDKFKHNIKTANYNVVYSMAHQHPGLQHTKVFKAIESDFNARMEKAKHYILNHAENIDKIINDLFLSYKIIPSKMTLIRELIANKNTIHVFNNHIKNREWKICFTLLEQHKFLKDLSEYKKLLDMEKALFEKLEHLLKIENIKEAKKVALELEQFPRYKDKMGAINAKIEIIELFKKLYDTKDYDKMLDLVHKNHFLETYKEYKRFDRKWRENRMEALKLAKLGKIKQVIELFEDFENMKSKQKTIGHIVSSTHIQKFMLLEDNIKNIIPRVKRYLDTFGTTAELKHYFEFFQNKYELDISKNFEEIPFKGYEYYGVYRVENTN